MGFLKYLAALWVGVCVYVLFSFYSGPMGISAYRQLETERDKETANMENLQLISLNLKNTERAIMTDRDTITAYAREQGFIGTDERFARILGMGTPFRDIASPGQVLSPLSPEHTSDRTIKLFSFFTAITIILCMGAYDLLKYVKER